MPTKRHIPLPGSAGDRVLALARRRGVLRARDLIAYSIPRETLRRLHAAGRLTRRARGLYVAADLPRTEHQMLAEAAVRAPHGIVCLLSALRFHGLTTQNPSEVWLAIDHKARAPRVPELPLRIVYFSGSARRSGIQAHTIDGVRVRIYSPAKTVADCFKFRHKIGLDVALEALRECWRSRQCTMDALWKYARVCRVTNVMRPYLESLV
jgi:predicted transcriptional regulator of viral defense system